jgi:hypothetical protein
MEQLQALWRFALADVWPTRTKPKDEDFRLGLEWATEPIGGFGSTESLIRAREIDQEARLTLHDALAKRWRFNAPTALMSKDGEWQCSRLSSHTDDLDADALWAGSRAVGVAQQRKAWTLAAARGGHPKAQLEMARSTLGEESWAWVELAASQDDPDAACALGMRLLSMGVAEGLTHLEVAAKRSSSSAVRALANLNGYRDFKLVSAILQEAADLGNPEAEAVLGALLIRRGDKHGAMGHLSIGLRHHSASAANTMALLIADDQVGPEARLNLQAAAANGDSWSTAALGSSLLAAGDLDGAIPHLIAASRANPSIPRVMGDLAEHPHHGSLMWSVLRADAVTGHPNAALALGEMHFARGDIPTSIQYFASAALRGLFAAAKALAELVHHPQYSEMAFAELRTIAATRPGLIARVSQEASFTADHPGFLNLLVENAQAGDFASIQGLASLIYDESIGPTAEAALEELARTGDARAAAALGRRYFARGSVERAFPYIKSASLAGDSSVFRSLIALLVHPTLGAASTETLEQLAASGNVEASLGLGRSRLYRGDYAGAARLLAMAAEKGSSGGIKVARALVGHPDIGDRALTALKKAFGRGIPQAALALGQVSLYSGDAELGFYYLQAALSRGEAGAINAVKDLIGHPKLGEAPEKSLFEAAAKGDSATALVVGRLHLYHGAVEEAYSYFSTAFWGGETGAVRALADLIDNPLVGPLVTATLQEAALGGNRRAEDALQPRGFGKAGRVRTRSRRRRSDREES